MQNTAAYLPVIVIFIFAGLNTASSANCVTHDAKCSAATPCCKPEEYKCLKGQCYQRSGNTGPCDWDLNKPCKKGLRCSKGKCTDEPCSWHGGECKTSNNCCATKNFCKHGRCEGSCAKPHKYVDAITGTTVEAGSLCATYFRLGAEGCCVGWECREVGPMAIGGFGGKCRKIKTCNRTKEKCDTGKCCDRNDECKKGVCTKTYGTEEDGFSNWINSFYGGY